MILPIAVVAALWAQSDDGCPRKLKLFTPVTSATAYVPLSQGKAQATFNFQFTNDEEDEPDDKDSKAGVKAAREAREYRVRARTEWQSHQSEIRDAMRQAQKEMEKLGSAKQFISDPALTQGFASAFVDFGGPEPRLSLEIDNLPIRDAIQKVFKATKYEVSFDDTVPSDVRITVKVPNVRLSTALDMITDAGNVKWTRDWRFSADSAKPIIQYRICKAVPADHMIFLKPGPAGPPRVVQIGPGSKLLASGTATQSLINVIIPEERLSVRCPHCHAKIVRTVTKAAPRAPGAPRIASPPPAPAKQWKFCPFCGKPVDFED
jgi:hypothetical protein